MSYFCIDLKSNASKETQICAKALNQRLGLLDSPFLASKWEIAFNTSSVTIWLMEWNYFFSFSMHPLVLLK